jgi:hypothetical protein
MTSEGHHPVRRLLLAITAAILATLTIAAPASAQGATSVTLYNLPSGGCNIGATGGIETDANVIINSTRDKVMATVSIKDGAPNTVYTINLVQIPSGENCFGAEATLTTNAQGNGTVHLSEPILPSSTGAFVTVIGGFEFRASEAAVLD